MMGARKAQSFPCPANESQATSLVDEICEASTPTGYHSSDMVTIENGADEPATILCGYHELRRLMRQGTAERARRVTAGSGGSGGPGGWW